MAQEQNKPEVAYVRMNLSGDPSTFEEGEYAYMLNGIMEDGDGSDPFGVSIGGTILVGVLPDGYIKIGQLNIAHQLTVIWCVNPTTGDSEIGWIDEEYKYHTKVSDKDLNFHIDHQVKAKFKTNYKGDRILYWVDDLRNDIRTMNFDSPPFVRTLVNGQIVTTTKLDLDQMKLFKNYSQPRVTIDSVPSNGILPAALYYVITQYADAKGNGLTAWGFLNGPVPIYRDSLDISYEFLSGSEPETPTNKAIRILLSGQDLSFSYINIGIIRIMNGVPEGFRMLSPVTITQSEYIFTGAPNLMVPADLNELLAPPVVYATGKTLDESDGSLVIGNLKDKAKYNYQQHFNNVQMLWQVTRRKLNTKPGNFKNPLNTMLQKTYRFDEAYAIGMVIEFTDGTYSDNIIFPARRANMNSKGVSINRPVDAFGQPLQQLRWDTSPVQNNADIYETTSQPRWKIYNTATYEGTLMPVGQTEGLAEFGELGYYESTDRYPNDPTVWGTNAGQPIRIPRMPDSTILHLHNGANLNRDTGEYPSVNLLGLRFPNLDQLVNALPADIKKQIKGYRIIRSDRTYSKSVVASGMLFNCMLHDFRQKGTDDPDIRLVPNFPLNDTRPNPYILDRTNIDANGITIAPKRGNGNYTNTSFTFISPDTAFNKTVLAASELKINGEIYGKGQAQHFYLRPFPKLEGSSGGSKGNALAGAIVGWYNNYKLPRIGNTRRRILSSLYAPADTQVAAGSVGSPLYNIGRESTVFVSVDKPVAGTIIVDQSRFTLNNAPLDIVKDDEKMNCNPDRKVKRTVSAHYVTLKNNLVNQYGNVQDFRFIDTGFTDQHVKAGVAIYGGDTFVGAFSQKRMVNLFSDIQDWIEAPDNADGMDNFAFMNIPGTEWYYRNVDKPQKDSITMCAKDNSGFNSDDLGYVPMMFYGVPLFFTESDINLDLRLPGVSNEDTYYPNMNGGSVTLANWLNVKGINVDNQFRHNPDYSFISDLKVFTPVDPLFDPKNNKVTHFNTRAIRSLRSQPEDISDNWQIFKPLDYYDFKKSAGDLIDIRYIGNGRTLFRMEKALFEANLYDSLQTGLGKEIQLGSGRLFANDPIEKFFTDQGIAGTMSQWACDVTDSGVFMVDAANRKVYTYVGGQLDDLTRYKAADWLWKHMELSLKRQLPAIPGDNPANPEGTGYISQWDSTTDSWILTKKDYEFINYADYTSATYDNGRILVKGEPVSVHDRDMFINRSFTLIFRPKNKGWISFESFIPDSYLARANEVFSFTTENGDCGMNKHHQSNIGNFYGKQYPFIVELNTKLSDIQQQATSSFSFVTRAYRRENQYVREINKTFQKMMVFNDFQNSGMMNMVLLDENKLSTRYKPLKTANEFREVPLKLFNGVYNVSDFYDVYTGGPYPPFSDNWNNADYVRDYPIDKVLIDSMMDYGRHYSKAAPFRGHWIRVRLIYDDPGDVKLLLKMGMLRTRGSYP